MIVLKARDMKYYSTKVYRYLLLFGAMITLAACADIDLDDDDFVKKPMSFTAGRSFDPTRAVTTNLQDDLFDDGEEINVFIQGSIDGGNTWTEPILDHDGEEVGTSARPAVFVTAGLSGGINKLSPKIASTQPYYPVNPPDGSTSDVKAKIFAAYPKSVTPLTTTFTVQYDQREERGYKNSDLMLVTPFEHAKNKQVINLPFKHKMSKLIVTAIPDGDVTIDPDITIGSLWRGVDIDVENGDFAYSATAPTTIPLSDENSGDYSLRKIQIVNGGAVTFPPQYLQAGPEFIMITGKVKLKDDSGDPILDASGNPIWEPRTSQFDILDKTFKEGRVYKLNLHIGENDFKLNPNDNNSHHVSTITGWSEDYDELTVTPSGGYSGVTISAINGNVTDPDIPHTEAGNYIFTGEPRCPTPTVTYGDDQKILEEGTDFRFVYVDNVNAGNNAQVMVLGMGAYAGLAALKPFTIERAKAKITFPEGSDKTLENGNAVDFNPDDNIGHIDALNTGDGDVIYSVIAADDTENTDCASVDPIDGTVIVQNVGTCTIKATASAGLNYDYPEPDNTCTYKVQIVPKVVKVGNISVEYEPKSFVFDDTDKKLTKLVVVDSDGEHTLVEDVDYTYTFTNVRHHGNAKLTITGKGNYSESTKIEIEIPINQAKPTITVKETELALGIQTSTAPKTRKKTREATTEDWAKNKLRFSLSPTADVKSNSVLSVTNNGLLTGISEGTATVYVSIDADDSENTDWIAADQKSFNVRVYPSDFTFRISRYPASITKNGTTYTYREPQVKIGTDGIPEGAHTEWVCPAKGEWQIDCYGAQGGSTPTHTSELKGWARPADSETGTPAIQADQPYANQGTGGRGAHIAGRINLPKGQLLHVNLGQKGRVVYPGEQRVRGPQSEIATNSYTAHTGNEFNSPNTNCTANRGRNTGKRTPAIIGDKGYVKAGDYEWAAFAWNGGGGFVWGGRCVYKYTNFYNQDNDWVGNGGQTQNSPTATGSSDVIRGQGQSFIVFPITGGGGATDVSLAWDESDGRYTPPTTDYSESVRTNAWQNGTGHAMVNREYGVGGTLGDGGNMVGLQWKNPAHLFSRIIVAGGGGGGLYYDSNNSFGDGGDGGAWEGTQGLFQDSGEGGHMNAAGRGGIWLNWNMTLSDGSKIWARDDNRTSEYNASGTGTNWHTDMVYMDGGYAGGYSCSDGLFGEGGYSTQSAQGCGGGGGGWYGGGAGAESGDNGCGGGGSSFMWTDKATAKRYISSMRSDSQIGGAYRSTVNYEASEVLMYKLYDTIDADWVNYNKCITGANIKIPNPTTPPAHIRAANYKKFMPTNSSVDKTSSGRNSSDGIECPFFHEVVTKDAGVNAGDGWAKITLVEIDDEQ